MNITLDDLREKMKAAYPDARRWLFTDSDRASMRQFWDHVDSIIEIHNEQPSGGIIRPDIVRFHRAGLIYYHAKKHGVKSAMLWKLSN